MKTLYRHPLVLLFFALGIGVFIWIKLTPPARTTPAAITAAPLPATPAQPAPPLSPLPFTAGAAATTAVSMPDPSSALPALPTATAELAGKIVPLIANDIGLYPQVEVGLRQAIPLTVAFPAAAPGDLVSFSAEDGGALDKELPTQVVVLDDDRRAHLTFTTSVNEGIYRVTARHLTEQRQFSFWVGPPLPLKVSGPNHPSSPFAH